MQRDLDDRQMEQLLRTVAEMFVFQRSFWLTEATREEISLSCLAIIRICSACVSMQTVSTFSMFPLLSLFFCDRWGMTPHRSRCYASVLAGSSLAAAAA